MHTNEGQNTKVQNPSDIFFEYSDADIFAKTRSFNKLVDIGKQLGFYFMENILLSDVKNHVTILDPFTNKEREMIMMRSSYYLGLNTHPKVIETAIEATKKYGPGVSNVLGLGKYDVVRDLEIRIAKFKGCEDAILFPTGYSANNGIITALLRKNDISIIDTFAHASIHDACKLSYGSKVTFEHNDLNSLDEALKKCNNTYQGKIIIVDGVYSMSGDIAPLPGIIDLAKKYNARLMVDDAHATGVIGKSGKGTQEFFNVKGQIDIFMLTFNKSLGIHGAAAIGSKEVINYIKHYGRSYMFSTGISPVIASCINTALDVLEQEPEIREQLWKNVNYMKKNLKDLGFNIGDTQSAIVPVYVNFSEEDNTRESILKSFDDSMINNLKDIGIENESISVNGYKLAEMCRALYDEGIYTNVVVFPAVPKNLSRYRLGIMATHTQNDLDRTLEAFKKVGRQFGVI